MINDQQSLLQTNFQNPCQSNTQCKLNLRVELKGRKLTAVHTT
jgi:hypothetical protein